MTLTPFEWPQYHLDRVRKVFEPRYGEKLSDERVINIANNLYGYAVVCYDSWKKRIKKEEDEIRTRKRNGGQEFPHTEEGQDKLRN
ncbi:MAG: hypothetical protein ABIE03_01735 [Patescibacteria group bacterium]|nr:hypothetical protein [Patescibacteria group bacterium]